MLFTKKEKTLVVVKWSENCEFGFDHVVYGDTRVEMSGEQVGVWVPRDALAGAQSAVQKGQPPPWAWRVKEASLEEGVLEEGRAARTEPWGPPTPLNEALY